jgi:hypothetical protein
MEYPSQEVLREKFDYIDGNLIWKKSQYGLAAGAKAGTIMKRGYVIVGVNSTRYYAHRLVWIWHYGEIQTEMIDHINGLRHDNKIENLRQATRSQNFQNRKISSANTSGIKGVCFCKTKKMWIAKVQLDKKVVFCKYFHAKEDAAIAYQTESKKYFGNFARVG